MAKGKSTSSASSATKKKQAKKAEKRDERNKVRAIEEEEQELAELEREGDDGSDAEPPSTTKTSGQDDVVEGNAGADEQGGGVAASTATDGTADSSSAALEGPAASSTSKATPRPPATGSQQQQQRDRRGKLHKEVVPAQGKQRGEAATKKKQKKKHKKGEAPPPPRKKQYIPPPKPPRDNLDPIDIFGLGVTGGGYQRIDPEHVVTLRLLNKKDASSVERGLDELTAWIMSVGQGDAGEKAARTDVQEGRESRDETEAMQEVAEMLPVWTHHYPRLSSHTSRRVRLSTASVHAHFLHQGPDTLLRDFTVPTLTAPATLEKDDYLSSMLCASFDPDRQIRILSVSNWQALQERHQVALDGYAKEILDSLNSTILESSALAGTGAGLPSQKQLAKMDDDARIALQEEQDQKSSQLAASIDAFTYMLGRPSADEARPELYEPVLDSDLFWSYLHPARMEAAHVRRAVWRTLGAATRSSSVGLPALRSALRTLSRTVLQAAFGERDYNTHGVLSVALPDFLETFPEAWKLYGKHTQPNSIATDESDESSESSSSDDDVDSAKANGREAASPPASVAALLDALQIGFYGNASSGYKCLPRLVRTVPVSQLPIDASRLELLFSSLWAGFSGRALDSAGEAGLSAFAEAVAQLVIDFEAQLEPASGELALALLDKQLSRLWQYYLEVLPSPSRSSSLAKRTTVTHLLYALNQLQTKRQDSLARIWPQLEGPALGLFAAGSTAKPGQLQRLADALARFVSGETGAKELGERAAMLEFATVREALRNLSRSGYAEYVRLLLLSDARALLADPSLASELDKAMLSEPTPPLELVEVYLQTRQSEAEEAAVWAKVCSQTSGAIGSDGLAGLRSLLEINMRLQSRLPNPNMDGAIEDHLRRTLSAAKTDGAVDDGKIMSDLLTKNAGLVSDTFATRVAAMLISHLDTLASDAIVTGKGVGSAADFALNMLNFIDVATLETCPSESPAAAVAFELAYLLESTVDISESAVQAARQIWTKLASSSSGLSQPDLAALVASRLGSYVLTEGCYASGPQLVEAATQLEKLPHVSTSDVWSAFLPSREAVDELARDIYAIDVPAIVAVQEPLVRLAGKEHNVTSAASDGVLRKPAFQRAMLAWAAVLTERHSMVTEHAYMLEYFVLLAETIQDADRLSDPSSSARADGQAIRAVAERISAHIANSIASRFPADWHTTAVQSLRKEYAGNGMGIQLVQSALHRTASQTSDYGCRVLSRLCALLLRYSDATEADAERWLAFAQGIQAKNGDGCLAIVYAIRPLLLESPRFHRYQGELASSLSGVKLSRFNEQALPLLRLLIAVAPPSTSERELLPSNRAIFLVQSIQKWFADDAEDFDMDEAAHVYLVEVFRCLISSLQGLSGSHWNTIFDLLESNIETASWSDPPSLPGLAAACLLLDEIHDVASRNQDFRNVVKPSWRNAYSLLQETFAGASARSTPSAAHGAVLTSVSRTILHAGAMDEKHLPALLELLQRPHSSLQQAVYTTAAAVIRASVDSLVLTIETRRQEDDSALPEIVLPEKLLALTQVPDASARPALLAWLLVFIYFQDTTPVIKAAYVEQLRRSGSVKHGLLPLVFGLLGVSDRGRGLDLAPWATEVFDVELLGEFEEDKGLEQLAAHVYHRALQTVPSLIRAEWENYTNKQYSMAVAGYTAKYFSPLLIEREMARVQEAEQKDTLRDENMAIKLLHSVNEVKATYTVDEQPMEISVRLPPEYPLVAVEVKDGKRIGIPDSTWRAWMLNVQLVITNQNGSIADALGLFKANASRHFEGVEACSICYSVISVTDRTVPSKRCRTCKAGFHAGCLYKWFSTSKGSSCPLCRSLF